MSLVPNTPACLPAMKRDRYLTRLFAAALAAGGLALSSASAADTALTKVYDATGNYGISMRGKGLDGLSGAVTIDTLPVGGPVAKAILYWGGKESSNYAKNPSIRLRIDGGGGSPFNLPWTKVSGTHGYLHSNHFVRSADITSLLKGMVAGDYTVSVEEFTNLRGACIQIVYSDGALPNSRVQIFGRGLDYQYIGRGNNQDGEGKTFVHDIDINAPSAEVHVFANDAYWDRTGTPRFERIYYKQGIGALSGAYGTGELVKNNGSNSLGVDPDATLLAENFLEGSDGKDWDTYRATISLTPGTSTKLSLDIQSVDESFSIPSVAFRSAAGASATNVPPAVWAMAEQGDRKVIIGGEFLSSHGIPRRNIARLNTDGTVDTTFNPGSGFNGAVRGIAVRGDGKILVGGEFSAYNGQPASRVVLLDPDGSMSGTLHTPGQNSVWWVGVLPDGKMLYAGDFRSVGNLRRVGIARLNANGTLDDGFTTGSGSDGKLVEHVLASDDGTLVLTGKFTQFDGVQVNGIARLDSTGQLLGSLSELVGGALEGGTLESGADGATASAARQADGKILIAGRFSKWNGMGANQLARLNADGTHDTSLAPNPLAVTSLRDVIGERTEASWSGGDGTGGVIGGTVYTGETTVSDSSDDAEEMADGTVLLRSPDLELGMDDGTTEQTVGIRFALPAALGQTISAAHIVFTANATSSGAGNLQIRAQARDDAPIFSDQSGDLSGRPPGDASVTWQPAPWTIGSSGAAQTTPDLKALVQEAIDRPGWEPGNSIAFLITGTGLRSAKSFDSDPSLAPRLVLGWGSDGQTLLSDAIALYTFEENSVSAVEDVSGYGAPLNLAVENASASASGGVLAMTGPNRASNSADGSKIFTALKASNAMSVEAWVTPANTSQAGPARMVTLSTDTSNRNFTLGQDGSRFEARIRTTTNGNNGDTKKLLSASGTAGTGLTHVLFTRDDAGAATLYLNGATVHTDVISGDFSNWNSSYDFGLGNEFATASNNPDRDWQGAFHRVAIFDRALSGSEVYALYSGGGGDGEGGGGGAATGTITAEFWGNIEGVSVSDLLADSRYPSNPDQKGEISKFQIPTDVADHYGARVHGYIIPSSSGTYRFFISGDDESHLFLSSDDSPANLSHEPIARVVAWTYPLEWSKYPEQRSASVSLVAGQRYYVRAFMKEGEGGDNLAVGWTGPGIDAITVIPGENLAPWDGGVTGSGVPQVTTGSIGIEAWDGISGTAVSDLTSHPKFPDNPSLAGTLASFEIPSNQGDNYGIRIQGYIVPPTTGSYEFYISGDDESQLFLSADASPDKLSSSPIGHVPTSTSPRQWNKFASQKSSPVFLVADRPYFVRAYMKEGTGSDHLAVGWTGPGIGSITVIPGSQLAPYEGGDASAALPEILAFEAEEGVISGTKFQVGNDAAASGGAYVHVPNGLGGSPGADYVTYRFRVNTAGTFRIRANVHAANGSDDSFFVRVPGKSSGDGFLWDAQQNSTYAEDYVNDRDRADPVEFDLPVGEVAVEVAAREDGTRLDRIWLERR
ncbi:hypothetical protein BH23VER1_BH23VER1_02390 [soil metagenome]